MNKSWERKAKRWAKMSVKRKEARLQKLVQKNRSGPLAELIQHLEYWDRYEVSQMLKRIDSQAAAHVLLDLLQHSEFSVVSAARDGLCKPLLQKAAVERITQALEQDLQDGDIENIIDSLACSDDARLIETLKKWLISPSWLRRMAAQALSRCGETAYEKIILGDTDDFDLLYEKDGEACLRWSRLMKDRVARYLEQDRDSVACAKALCMIGDERGIAKLDRMLAAGVQRYDVIRALLKIDVKKAADAIMQDIETISDDIEEKTLSLLDEAARAISAGQLADALEHVNTKQYGSDKKIMALAKALGQKKETAFAEVLKQRLIASREVRLCVAKQISKLGEPEYEQIVRGDTDDFARLIEKDGEACLEWIRGAKEWLAEARSHDEDVAAMAEALFRIGDKRGKEMLYHLISAADIPIKRVAIDKLAKLGEPIWANIFQDGQFNVLRLAQYEDELSDKMIATFFSQCIAHDRAVMAEAFISAQSSKFEKKQYTTHTDRAHTDKSDHTDHGGDHEDDGYTEEDLMYGYRIYNYRPHTDTTEPHEDSSSHEDEAHVDCTHQYTEYSCKLDF